MVGQVSSSKGRVLDRVETTELPGNDASWYRALLEEESPPQPVTGHADTTDADTSEPVRVDQLPDAEPPEPVVLQPTRELDDEYPGQEAEPADTTEPGFTEAMGADTEPREDAPDGLDELAPLLIAPEEEETVSAPAKTAEPTPAPETDEAPEAAFVAEPVSPVMEAAELPAAPDDVVLEDHEPVAADEELEPGDAQPESEDEPHQSPSERSAEMVGQLWTAHASEGPIEGWVPDDMDSTMSLSRSFRWTSVVATIAVLALVIVGLVLLPSITRNRADAHRAMMVEALHGLRAELPDTQDSLAVATEPTSTVTALNNLSTQLTSLSAKATGVDHAGREPLPSTLPFTSSAPIDELAPIQQRLEPLATTALTIQQRIANLVQYRTLMQDFLTLPDLPTSADDATQADLRVALASAQAESASILSELPDDVSLSEHRARALELNKTFATWQVDYVEALRTQDTVAAEALIGDIRYDIEQLDAALVTPLAQIRRQTDADLIDLASSIDEVVALATGEEPAP